jgi:type IV pilus assembly protein PilA
MKGKAGAPSGAPADLDRQNQYQGEVMLRKLHERISERQGGFSLIELLVVILIIGILAAIALPAFLGQRSKGEDSSAKSAARNLVSSVEAFYATNKTYVGADSDNDVKKSGVFGTGDGEATISSATGDGYTIVAQSASGNHFTITKDAAGDALDRTCDTKDSGGCPSSGDW